MTYLNIISHQYRDKYRELVELNTRGRGEEGHGSDEQREEDSRQEPPTPIDGVQDEGEERPMDEEADAEPFEVVQEPPVWQKEQEPPRVEEVEEALGMVVQPREGWQEGEKGPGGVSGEDRFGAQHGFL